jgi:putative ABC transport system permease protein
MVIAWINYVNLSTAKVLDRAKEVGVRKVMGALKGQLIRQFLGKRL